jgi:very-short-patch-repair endonuclease
MPERVCFAGPVVFTLAARAVVDATRELRSFWDVRALIADAVQQGHCRIDTLAGELARGPVRSSAWFRQALSEVASGVRSAAEADLRNLIIRAGLPVPIFNARLYLDGKLVAIADAWWAAARVAVEVDSRQWHLSPDDHEQTLRRSAALAALGIVVLHFTPGQIRRESAQVVAAIRAAVAGDGRRGGPVIHVLPADR